MTDNGGFVRRAEKIQTIEETGPGNRVPRNRDLREGAEKAMNMLLPIPSRGSPPFRHRQNPQPLV